MGDEGLEQIWGHITDDRTLIVCCVPFFATNIALGDEVKLDEDGHFVCVIGDAGQYTYRIYFGNVDASICDEVRAAVTLKFERNYLPMEWWTEDLLAVSVTGLEEATKIWDYLMKEENAGRLAFDTGRRGTSSVPPRAFEVPRAAHILPDFVRVTDPHNRVESEKFELTRHTAPAWLEQADCVFYAKIGSLSGSATWEQLYGKRSADNRAIICCIPFGLYDVQLGDEVEIDHDNVFVRMLRPSGQLAYRVYLHESYQTFEQDVRKLVKDQPIEIEWKFPANPYISIPPSCYAEFAAYFAEKQGERYLTYDISTT